MSDLRTPAQRSHALGPGRDSLVWLMIALVLVGLTGLLHLALDIGRPYGGYLTGRTLLQPRWFVDNVTPPHWSGLNGTGLARASELLALNGRPYGFDEREVFASAWAAGHRQVDLTFSINGSLRTIQLPIVRFSWQDYLDATLPEIILAVSFWLLAIAVYRSRPEDSVNRTAALFFVILGAYRLNAWPALFRDGDVVARVLDYAFVGLLWPAFTALWAHFALLFPNTSRLLRPWTLALIYLNSFAIAVGYAWVRATWWATGWTPAIGLNDDILWRWLTYSFLGAVGLVVARLVILTVDPRTSYRARRQSAIFLLGMLVTLVPIVTWAISAYGPSENGFFFGGLDLRYLFLGAPLALAYVVVRYRTFRSSHPLLRLVVDIASSALLASVAAWIWWQRQPQVIQDLVAPPFLPLLLLLFYVVGVWVVQRFLGNILTRLFNRDSVRIEQSRRFGLALADLPASVDAPARLAETLTRVLHVERAALWRLSPGGALALVSTAGTWRQPPPGYLAVALAAAAQPQPLQAPGARLDTQSRALAQAGLELVLPLRGPDGPLGLLALGPRPDEEVFDERDVDALQLIAQQTALFLLSAEQIEEIQRMAQALDQAQEVERLRIAHELHDTTQQSLNGLAFSLTLIRRRLQQDPAQLETLISQSITETQQAIQTLYQIRYNLDMSELDNGLAEPVRNMLERFGQRWGWRIDFTTTEGVDRVLTAAGRSALFRLIHQSLENAAAHARATTVRVALDLDGDKVSFDVVDDGIGSTVEERALAAANGHLGLRTMRTRIESLGGAFRFDSAPGAGTRVSGWVPATASQAA